MYSILPRPCFHMKLSCWLISDSCTDNESTKTSEQGFQVLICIIIRPLALSLAVIGSVRSHASIPPAICLWKAMHHGPSSKPLPPQLLSEFLPIFLIMTHRPLKSPLKIPGLWQDKFINGITTFIGRHWT